MPRPVRHISAVLAAACLALAAVCAGARAAEPASDSVTGIGLASESVPVLYAIDAHSGPSGENPTGTVSASEVAGGHSFVLSGTVTCLGVHGNTAIIGATLEGVDTPPIQRLIEIVDNTAAGGQDTLSEEDGPFAPSQCASLANPQGPFPVFPAPANDPGAFTVVDAQPVPTSKDQCKKSGWQTYGAMFKDQGECVAFVERQSHG